MAITKKLERQYSNEFINIEEMIHENHFLRVIEKHFDWNFIYDEVEKLYSKVGRKSIDPVVLVKIHILKFLFHEDSLRRTYENLKYNNLYRWFIGYNLNEDTPDHSTYSQNYRRKFCKLEKDILQTVFDKVIDLLSKEAKPFIINEYIKNYNNSSWWTKTYNRSTYYKIRKAALDEFLNYVE